MITAWQMEQELRTGKYSIPTTTLKLPALICFPMRRPFLRAKSVGNTYFEIYDYPGEYLKQAEGKSAG